MQIDKRPRSVLKTYFATNAIPTEAQFAELIDGGINQRDDGLYKAAGDPLAVEAAGDDAGMKRTVAFFSSFADQNPAWTIALKARRAPADPATARPGWSVLDASGTARLTIDAANGSVGVGTLQPREKLEVDGRVRAGPMTMGVWAPDAAYAAIGNNALDPAARETYALLQHANGTTLVNSIGALSLRVRNEDRVVVSDVDVLLTRPLRLGATTIGPWPVNPGYMHVGLNTLDQRQPGNYALLIGDTAERGVTFLNSPSRVNLRIGNADRLVVDDAAVTVARGLRVGGPLVPSAGNGAGAGINFPENAAGGGGDGAWVRYYARSGEAMTLEIGVANDADDHIALVSSGNVGIGVLDPTAKLDVAGDGLVRGSLRVAGDVTLDKALRVPVLTGPGGGPLRIAGEALVAGVLRAGAVTGTDGPLRIVAPETIVDGTLRANTIAATTGAVTVAAPLALQSDVAIGGKHALRGNDGWLRLNQERQFPSGTHTPGLFAPLSLNVGAAWEGWNNPGDGNIAYAGRLNKLDVMPQGQANLNCCDLMMGGSKVPGRRQSPGRAVIDLGDKLIFNYAGDWATTELHGRVVVPGVLTPSAGGGANAGIRFPTDPFGGGGDNAWIQYVSRGGEATTLEIGISNDADDHIALMPSGNVGVGTQNPQAKLDVIGEVRCRGFNNFSSGALKKNVRPLDSARAAAIVGSLDPVRFEWKAGETREQLGFIAEDCPAAVTTAQRDGVSISHVIAALTRVVRDQTATVAALTDRLAVLEARA